MKKLIIEFIGTFFLVFTVGTAAGMANAGDHAPLAIGAALMVMIFAGGHISGAHYNPAVSLAVMLRGKLPTKELTSYLIAQLAGAAAAALIVTKVMGSVPSIPVAESSAARLLAEFLFTFALCHVVLNVATADGTKGNSFYGLAIGFTVMAGAFAVGKISAGVFNPAVGVGLIVMGGLEASVVLPYMLVQFAAAFLASVIFKQTALKA